MKYYACLFLFFLGIHFSWSQDLKRPLINGQITVANSDVEGVSIYNTSTKKGTITDNKGVFSIEAGLDDKLEISALLYKKRIIIINADMLKNKSLKISLVETINALDEVVVLPYELTGNITEDIESSKVVAPYDFSYGSFEDYEFSDDYKSKVKNIAVNNGVLENGLNFVTIFTELILPLLKSKKDKKVKHSKSSDDIKRSNIHSYRFISKNFNIPEDEIGLFLQYVENNGLTEALLKKENEMELIAFLYEKSKQYLTEKKDED